MFIYFRHSSEFMIFIGDVHPFKSLEIRLFTTKHMMLNTRQRISIIRRYGTKVDS